MPTFLKGLPTKLEIANLDKSRSVLVAEGRYRKTRILAILESSTWEKDLQELLDLPNIQSAIAPLFSALCAAHPSVRWHAITAFGLLVNRIAAETPEKARVIMRRFIWSLNDESGGIGWGAPEAMAEIMVQNSRMAHEYHNHLAAYIHEDECRPDCYLEHAPLRRGAVWGVARLAQIRPELLRATEDDLLCCLNDQDTTICGLAAWACGLLRLPSAKSPLKRLLENERPFELYRDRVLSTETPAFLAQEALGRISGSRPLTI